MLNNCGFCVVYLYCVDFILLVVLYVAVWLVVCYRCFLELSTFVLGFVVGSVRIVVNYGPFVWARDCFARV